jgi:hypothetical protein
MSSLKEGPNYVSIEVKLKRKSTAIELQQGLSSKEDIFGYYFEGAIIVL